MSQIVTKSQHLQSTIYSNSNHSFLSMSISQLNRGRMSKTNTRVNPQGLQVTAAVSITRPHPSKTSLFPAKRTRQGRRAPASRALDQTLPQVWKLLRGCQSWWWRWRWCTTWRKAEKQKGFARQSLGDRLQASREAMTMLKQNKWTILTDKNCSLENGRIDTQNK